MTYVHTVSGPHPREARRDAAPKNKAGFFRRLLDSLVEARTRQVERDIAVYLGGSSFTDETEREIERRFLSTPSRW